MFKETIILRILRRKRLTLGPMLPFSPFKRPEACVLFKNLLQQLFSVQRQSLPSGGGGGGGKTINGSEPLPSLNIGSSDSA